MMNTVPLGTVWNDSNLSFGMKSFQLNKQYFLLRTICKDLNLHLEWFHSKRKIWIIPNGPYRDGINCLIDDEYCPFRDCLEWFKSFIWNEIISIEQTILLVKDHLQWFESSFGMISFQMKKIFQLKKILVVYGPFAMIWTFNKNDFLCKETKESLKKPYRTQCRIWLEFCVQTDKG